MDSCLLVKKSKESFSPIKEAITNSIDSISQRIDKKELFSPQIKVELYYSREKNVFGENETPKLHHVIVEDNGVGFNNENFERFKNLADTTKNQNNRGTGKIQFFCRFEEVNITSFYYESNKKWRRDIFWNRKGDFSEKNTEEEDNSILPLTTLEMRKPILDKSDEQVFASYFQDDLTALKGDIFRFFLLRLWIEQERNKEFSIVISTFLNEEEVCTFSIDRNTILKPLAEQIVPIKKYEAEVQSDNGKTLVVFNSIEPTHQLKLVVFNIAGVLFSENTVSLCSKGITIESFPLPYMKKGETVNGKVYLVCVYGSLFDDSNYINLRGDCFVFPNKKSIEKEILEGGAVLLEIGNGYYWFDEIKEAIINTVILVCNSIKEKKDQQVQRIKEVSSFFHFEESVAEEVSKKSSINDSERTITEKLFIEQAKHTAISSYSLKKTYDEIKQLKADKLNPLDSSYNSKLQSLTNQLLEQIPISNKDELSRYIIHRDLVVDVINLILKRDLAVQKEWEKRKIAGEELRKEPEGLLHDLIIKRKTTNNKNNELWLFNEDFVHYDSCSDIPFSKMTFNGEELFEKQEVVETLIAKYNLATDAKNTYRRPDVFLYPEEGKCIIIEFKSYEDKVTDYLDQIPFYARILACYSKKPIHLFYGYLIGSNIDSIRLNGWQPAVEADCWIKPAETIYSIVDATIPKATLYQELIDWKYVADRAKRRNYNFAKKLGIEA